MISDNFERALELGEHSEMCVSRKACVCVFTMTCNAPRLQLYQLCDGQRTMVDEYVLPPQSQGYGGGRMLVSSDEDYLILHLFSGQSSESFYVLHIKGRSLELIHVEEDSYGYCTHFVSRGGHLYWVRPQDTGSFSSYLWGTGDWHEYFHPEDPDHVDEDGYYFRKFLAVGSLHLKTSEVKRQDLYVRFGEEYLERLPQPLKCAGWIDTALRIEDKHLLITLPWGVEEVSVPLKEGVPLSVRFG